MCGRFSQTHTGEAIAAAFQLSTVPDLRPCYNIAPTHSVSVITQSRGAKERLHHHKRWGLVPGWAKDKKLGNRLINARSETLAAKPAFRNAFQRRRCLVVADGFYEWQAALPSPTQRQAKQPFFIQLKSRSPFAFAGLWERWQDPQTHQPLFSCTILTTQPNSLMASIHHRMPVILPPDAYDTWLDPSSYNPGVLEGLLRPYEATAMQVIPISTAINNPRNDSANVQKPLISEAETESQN